jgi:hypothetical protein
MTYEQLCDRHDELCATYNDTEDPALLEQICALEVMLIGEEFMPPPEEMGEEQ